MNIIFEILYLLSVFYLLGLYFSLFRNVVTHRRETKTSLGHKGEELKEQSEHILIFVKRYLLISS